MKYVNQLEYPHWPYINRTNMEEDEREAGKTKTVATSGCGLCAAMMVADRLLVAPDFDLQAALQLSYETKANHKKGTDYEIYAPAFAQKLGLKLEMTNDPERVRYCLRTGGAAVAHSGGDREGYVGVFTHGGHYVTLINEEPDGRIAVLDPSYKAGKYDEEGCRGKVEMKGEFIALCDLSVLAKDTENRDPGFYLFWRA